jgi:hypothetical protein
MAGFTGDLGAPSTRIPDFQDHEKVPHHSSGVFGDLVYHHRRHYDRIQPFVPRYALQPLLN